MDEVYINQETDPYVIEVDGTLDLAALQLQPATIVINGKKGLVDAQTSKTKRTLADIQQKVLHDATAGSMATPLRVSGASLAGTLDSIAGHGRDVSAEGISSSDLVKLRGKVKVLKKGDPETGDTKSISLYRSGGDPPSLQDKDGHLAGRLYLKNVNVMVPADTAMVEVVAPTREIRPPFLPEENSNGLSEELFAFDSVIRVSSYTGLSLVDDLAQDITSCLVNAFPTLIGPYLAWRQQFVHSKPD